MPSTIATDLAEAARLIRERGLWNGPGSFAHDSDNGPLDPVAALWHAAHGHLEFVFTAGLPGYADKATEMVLTDPRVLDAVEFLSANLTDDEAHYGADEAPIERIAQWVTTATASEVIGRLVRLAEPAHQLAA
ncbi:hypothetical protein KCMC57_64670 (plasmid) [Kitasatospora sp. CMC57]|uniref:Uncharacterized protein n=1 Tax=Kitasatospora sp. CMC57 TaxID=3231513 RepID=A0AB33K8V1_9ACTN